MTDTIIVAIVSFGGTLIGTLGGIITSSKLMMYRVEQLEKKVEKHNSIVERTFQLEEDSQILRERIKVINHRIDDLRNGGAKL